MLELLGRKPEVDGAGLERVSGAGRDIGLLVKLLDAVAGVCVLVLLVAGAAEEAVVVDDDDVGAELLLVAVSVEPVLPSAVSVLVSNNESSPLRRNIKSLPNGLF